MHTRRSVIVAAIAALPAVAATTAPAQPIAILDQTDNVGTENLLVIDSPYEAIGPIIPFDDLTTTHDWLLGQAQVFGLGSVNPTCFDAIPIVEVWSDRPDEGGVPIATAFGTLDPGGFTADFGGQFLPAGEYLIAAYMAVDPGAGPECAEAFFFIDRTSDVHDSEHLIWNPSGALGFGADPTKGTDALFTSGVPHDLAIRLEANQVALEDCNNNGVHDFVDVAIDLVSNDTNANGQPDECDQLLDADLDNVPDSSDPAPHTHDPNGGGFPAQVQLFQLDFQEADFTPVEQDTEHGLLIVEYPTVHDAELRINAEINGQWVVQNRFAHTLEVPSRHPTQREGFFIDLGVPRGTPLLAADVRVWIDPVGFQTPPLDPPADLVSVQSMNYDIGREFDDELAGELDDAENPAAGSERVPQICYETKENDGARAIDLDEWYEENSCSANAVAASFYWLNEKYKLGLNGTREDFLVEFRQRFMSINGAGTTAQKRLDGKNGFVNDFMLPITVEHDGIPYDHDDPVTPADIFDQLCKGQDVEISYGIYEFQFFPTIGWRRTGGHVVLVQRLSRCFDKADPDTTIGWEIRVHGDWRQGVEDSDAVFGVNIKLFSENLDLDRDGTSETVTTLDNTPFGSGPFTARVLESWTAESPTGAQLLKVAVLCAAQDYDTALDDAFMDGVLTLPEAETLLERAVDLKLNAFRYYSFLLALIPNVTSDELNAAVRQFVSACELVARVNRRVRELSGGGKSAAQLSDDLAFLSGEITSILTADYPVLDAALPPDADLDDVPDAMDNAPATPNPNQADDNNNGTPDILELSPLTDCNGNGLLDEVEVLIVGVVGLDANDDFILGNVFDLDGNGTPDDCDQAMIDCPGDANKDGFTNVFDFNLITGAFGGNTLFNQQGDVTGDGVVNVFDFNAVTGDFGCVAGIAP